MLYLYRGFSLCSNAEKFHQEISSLKSVFKGNGYPKNFIDSCLKHFLEKLFVKNKVSLTVPKLQLCACCPIPVDTRRRFNVYTSYRHDVADVV